MHLTADIKLLLERCGKVFAKITAIISLTAPDTWVIPSHNAFGLGHLNNFDQ